MAKLFLYLPPASVDHAVLWPGCALSLDLGDQQGAPGRVLDVVPGEDLVGTPEPLLELLRGLVERIDREREPAVLVRCRFDTPPSLDRLPATVRLELTDDADAHAHTLRDLGLEPAEFPGQRLKLLVLSINRRLAQDDGPDEYTLLCVHPDGSGGESGEGTPRISDDRAVPPQHVTHQSTPLDLAGIADIAAKAVGKLVVVCGHPGSGRSGVGRRLGGPRAQVLDANDLVRAVIDEARDKFAPAGGWPHYYADALVVDEVGWIDGRPRTLELLREALQRRCLAGQTTVLVQGRKDESLPELLVGLTPTLVDLIEPTKAVHAVS